MPGKRRSVVGAPMGSSAIHLGAAGGPNGYANDKDNACKELGSLKEDPAFREFFKLQDGFEWNGTTAHNILNDLSCTF